MPDQNLAEVLENVTGIQITRAAGVGTGVQIRGTNANRTEINGVSTVGSGGGRSGERTPRSRNANRGQARGGRGGSRGGGRRDEIKEVSQKEIDDKSCVCLTIFHLEN